MESGIYNYNDNRCDVWNSAHSSYARLRDNVRLCTAVILSHIAVVVKALKISHCQELEIYCPVC